MNDPVDAASAGRPPGEGRATASPGAPGPTGGTRPSGPAAGATATSATSAASAASATSTTSAAWRERGSSTSEWRRLHPLSPIVRAGRGIGAIVVVLLGSLASRHHSSRLTPLLIEVGVLAALCLVGFVSWLVTRWRIEDGALRIESGLLRRTSRRFPPEQLQAVDTVRPAVARVFGLAEVRVRMAASSGSSGRLAYLVDEEAELVRARLLALAHGVAENTPPPPERILLSIDTGRLLASIMLSGVGVVLETVIVALIVLAVADPVAVAPAVSVGATALIGLGTAAFRRLNGEYELTVAEAPDGLRFRSGLLQTSAETIPRGRVQGARLIEPLLWRPFGWCRLLVDVAGKQRSGDENRSVARGLRTVLPVGDHEQAAWLLERILPGVPQERHAPPTRARWKSPLRYHNLSWAADERYAVTTSGRVRRVTDLVPLAKVQSIRQMEGPVQRQLHLATLHLDTAGRSIHAAIRDRDREECRRLMVDLPEACRVARAVAAATE
jgi:putative membrane protein